MDYDSIWTYCLSLRHATQDIQWGNDLLFRIGGKIFAGMNRNLADIYFRENREPESRWQEPTNSCAKRYLRCSNKRGKDESRFHTQLLPVTSACNRRHSVGQRSLVQDRRQDLRRDESRAASFVGVQVHAGEVRRTDR